LHPSNMHLRVENHVGLVRDTNSNAILNTSDKDYDEYIKLKSKALSEKEKIANLESEVSELKDMVKLLLEKLDK